MSEMHCEVRPRLPTQIGPQQHGTARPVAVSADPVPRPVGKVGIVGANGTGVGIALRLLDAGIPATMYDSERTSLENGMALVRAHSQEAVANGALAGDQRDRRMALLAATVHFHHLKDCDLIIDAAPTETAVKEKLFRGLDQVAKPGAILMTCHAHCGIDHLAGFTRRSGEVLGLHFLSLASETAAWEFVRGRATSDETLATAAALARKLRDGAVSDVCPSP